MALSDGWYLAGPLIAFAVVGVLTAVLRRALSRDVPPADDFGLLAVAALTDRWEIAAGVRAALARAGIRSTAATGLDGLIRVLVFPDDAGRARGILRASPP